MMVEGTAVAYNNTGALNTLRRKIISKVEEADCEERLYQCLEALSESPMPCAFSEEELDKEIHISMKSGNAIQTEVDAVFNR